MPDHDRNPALAAAPGHAPAPVPPRHTLVTGADRGIGLGLVRHYLAAGKPVVATTRRPRAGAALAGLQGRHPDRLQVLELAVGDEASTAAFARAVATRGVGFELVINNAGISREEAFGDWTDAEFIDHFRVNAVGPTLLVQALKPFLARGSKVVQISSGMGSAQLNLNPAGPLDAYAASKCALDILSRRLAEKFRDQGVAVFAMSPGWVQTDMGGADATHTVEQAVQTMTATIAGAGMEYSGGFLSPDGSALPW